MVLLMSMEGNRIVCSLSCRGSLLNANGVIVSIFILKVPAFFYTPSVRLGWSSVIWGDRECLIFGVGINLVSPMKGQESIRRYLPRRKQAVFLKGSVSLSGRLREMIKHLHQHIVNPDDK